MPPAKPPPWWTPSPPRPAAPSRSSTPPPPTARPGWVYGFPELRAGQLDAVKTATRVSNPGCYATGAIALLHRWWLPA
jgi:hypothetical protein